MDNAKPVKDMGFTFIELNLEKSVSHDWDNNVVAAFKHAANAAHAQGLSFAAAPPKGYANTHGTR
jgi:hypothetical protein